MPSNKASQSSGCGCFLLTILIGGGFAVFILPYWPRPRPNWLYQRESLHYIGAMNRSQQAYYLETEALTSDIDRLGLGIATETQDYRYQAVLLSEMAVQHNGVSKDATQERFQAVKKFFYYYFGLGRYVERPLKSYTGLVRVVEDENGERTTTAIICESLEPTIETPPAFTLPDPPTAVEATISCPDGYRSL